MTLRTLIKYYFLPKKFISDFRNLIEQRFTDDLKKESLIPTTETRDEDIFIVGYPKSGNTWMQSLMAGVLYCTDTEILPDKLAQEIVPDVDARKYYKRFGNINFFKSHSLPVPEYKNVIYLVRDARDVMVSYYYYLKASGQNTGLDELIEEQNVPQGKWHEHIEAWHKNPYNAKIIYIRYEDLLADPRRELKKILSFFNIDKEDVELDRVIQGNSFAEMQRKADYYQEFGPKLRTKNREFFRKGEAGDYKNELNDKQINSITEKARGALKLFNYID